MLKKFTLKIEIEATQEDAVKINEALPVLIKNISADDFTRLKKLCIEKNSTFKQAINYLRNLF